MKDLFFRIGVILLIITAILGSIYSEALAYRRDTFSAAYGDVMYNSMIFSDITACSSEDGKPQLLVGGTVYPDDNRNGKKNAFFKLYGEDGRLIATSGINEMNCSLLLNDISKTPYGFAVICEVRGDNESYGKIYEYSHNGTYINSTYIKYADFAIQEAGTVYGLCIDKDATYYTAIDSEKTVCTDSEGKYLFSIPHEKNSTVCAAAIAGDILYTSGNIYNDDNIPKAFINAYDTKKKSVLWTENDFVVKNDSSEKIYSQADKINIITDDKEPVSLFLTGKYIDSSVYKKYIRDNKIDIEEDIDTASKKSIRETLPLYRTGRTKEDYINTPYPSVFFTAFDLNTKNQDTKLFEADEHISYSSVSVGTSTIESVESFTACLTGVSTANIDSEYFDTVIKGFDSSLAESFTTAVKEPVKHKTFFTTLSKEKFFTFTTINTTDVYSAKVFTPAEYAKHISKLDNYTKDIYLVENIISLIPFCIMVSLFYIMTRIRCLLRGMRYIPEGFFQKLLTQLADKIPKKQ